MGNVYFKPRRRLDISKSPSVKETRKNGKVEVYVDFYLMGKQK